MFLGSVFYSELFKGLLMATLEHSAALTDKLLCHAMSWKTLIEQQPIKLLWLLSGIFDLWEKYLKLSLAQFPYSEWFLCTPKSPLNWWKRNSPDTYYILNLKEFMEANPGHNASFRQAFPDTFNINPFRITRTYLENSVPEAELGISSLVPEYLQDSTRTSVNPRRDPGQSRGVSQWSMDLPNGEIFTQSLVHLCQRAVDQIFPAPPADITYSM